MKKYSASTLASCDSSVDSRSHPSRRLNLVAGLPAIQSLFVRWVAMSLVWLLPGFINLEFAQLATAQSSIHPSTYTQAEVRPTNQVQAGRIQPGQAPQNNRYAAQQSTYQYPATNPPGSTGTGSAITYGMQPQQNFQAPPSTQIPTPALGQPVFQQPQGGTTGQPGFVQPQIVLPPQPGFVDSNSPGVLDLDVTVPQALTQRLSVGATYGSDNGLVGQFIFDEKDFDIHNWPRSCSQMFSRNAWTGGGQQFRVEAVPGNELQRYLISWSNPYFLNTDHSLSVSGYTYERRYFDYDERRSGGRIGLGRQLSDYLSIDFGLRMENVKIDNPRVGTSAELNSVLGSSNLYLASIGLVYDTRVFPYLTGAGSYLGLKFTQGFGDYSYSRGDIDFRNYRTIYQRLDGSGRHTIGWRTKLGFTGSDTPIFENYIAGGMTSIRGFEYRGVSPIDGGVRVGGEFEWLNSLEYNFPLTQGDMVHGVMFVDFGTVEESVQIKSENFRVAPGLGLRVHLPYAGLAAPLAFDFAFPVSNATGDLEQNFGFQVGLMR